MSLCLTTIPAPEPAAAGAKVFATPADACRHLCDHVLVEPECFAWAAILPDWAGLLGEKRARRKRHNERTRLDHTEGESGQGLYDAFATALRDDAADADRLHWMEVWYPPPEAPPEFRPTAVYLGTRAMVMVFEKLSAGWVLKTAFIPEQGDPRETVRARENRRPRANQVPRRDAGHPREQHRREELEAEWSADERFFYRVFKPAVKFLRHHHGVRNVAPGRALDRHYGLLYDRLPHALTDDPRVWIAFRRACGRAAIDG